MTPDLRLSCCLLFFVGCGGTQASSAGPDLGSDDSGPPTVDGGSAPDLASTTAGAGSDMAMPASGSGSGWRTMSSTGEPERRSRASAVWTGSKMIVWGGASAATGSGLNTGGLYDPATDHWTAMSTTGAPSARVDHAAVWTGQEMIVWGGDTGAPSYTALGDGARYDPATDRWTPMAMQSAPGARALPSAVWTGTDLLIWSGQYTGGFGQTANGARYRPSEDRWHAITQTGAPLDGQDPATTAWTGTEMLVWVGDVSINPAPGALYDPALDQWHSMTTTGDPSIRYVAQGVWTGSDFLLFGGHTDTAAPSDVAKRYRPSTDSWQSIATTGEPEARSYCVTVWTGTSMIVWGGALYNQGLLASGAAYDPALDTWTPMRLPDDDGLTDQQREQAAAVWTGSELLIWGGIGTYDTKPLPGLRYQP